MLTYADQTASGRSLRYIEDYLVKDVLPFYGNTHTEDSHVGSKTTRLVHKAARYIKRCMGAGPNDVLIFCGSGTTAAIKRLQEVIGVAAPSVDLRGRLSTQLRPEERLADVVEIGVDADGLIDIAALRHALNSPKYKNRPMLGSFSACSNVTGIMTDTRQIARVLHQHGAYACFDFAASGPYVKIDMKSGEIDGYDAVFLSPHKFVGGPGTPGILLMNKGLYKLSSQPPSLCGGGTVAYVNGFSEEDTIYYDDIEEREDAGTPTNRPKDPYVTCILGQGVHWPSSDRWLEDLRRKRQPLHGRFVTRLFNDLFGIQARGGCACAGPYGHTLLKIENDLSLRLRSAILQGYSGLKPGWTRLSFSYYLSKEEFKFILSAIEFIASYGHRFLSLYKFDWITGNWTFKKEAIKYLLMKEELALGTSLDTLTENVLFKDDAKIEKKHRAIQNKFENYLESAKIIALSLPDIKQSTVAALSLEERQEAEHLDHECREAERQEAAHLQALQRDEEALAYSDQIAAVTSALHSQAMAVLKIKALVLITLDLASANFSRWRTLFVNTLKKYALTDHVFEDDDFSDNIY
ncbi:hypothetical protein PR202_ga03793 [Eleusine coracana subsp. coracana]|uniref:Aminotransferase class V domain-containing protein n=1 Tax=Eleusine coracana subsp. coracana TaxID=191504 RepID=A0AAV5BQ33_ELECO|nr:hypothetical protein PR202_ga03793 [Eleusine coracana subsp. coracana]